MTIGKNVLKMTSQELEAFVYERHRVRTSSEYKIKKRKPKEQTVGQTARDLGLDKTAVMELLEEELGEL